MGKDTLYIYIIITHTHLGFSTSVAMSRHGVYVVCLTGVGFIGQGSTLQLYTNVGGA